MKLDADHFRGTSGSWEVSADGVLTFLAKVGDNIKRFRVTPAPDMTIDKMVNEAEEKQAIAAAAKKKAEEDALAAKQKAEADKAAAAAKAKADYTAAAAAKAKARADAAAAKAAAREKK